MKHTSLFIAAATVLLGASAVADGHDGRVRAWIVSPEGQVDGVVLSDRSSVRFSGMTAQSVVRNVRVGERVQVTPDGQTFFVPRTNWSVDLGVASLGRGGGPSRLPPLSRTDRAADGMTISGGPARGTQHFNVRGVVGALTYTRGRQVDGFVIDGGITVRVSSSQPGDIGTLRPGARVSVEGDGMRGPQGIGIRATRVADARGGVLYTAAGGQ